MSVTRSIPVPGSGRITLGLLAVVPAVLAYPWQSTRERWVLGVALALVILLFGWWRGLHFTTILRRRVAILGRRSGPKPEAGIDTRTTALLRIGAPASNGDVLPLPLIARYLDRYGVRADAIRITNRDTASGDRETWVGLIVSAADNLAALQARSSQIPLHETAQVAARRLADHLRENGWEASTVGADEVPELIAPDARETWSAVRHSDSDYVAAYRVSVDSGLAERLTAIRSHPARETWTALEIGSASGRGSQLTVAAACAFRTDERPGGGAPVGGLTLQRGSQLPALLALDPLSTQRLDGHTNGFGDLLNQLVWPAPAAGNHRGAPSEAATEVIRT